MKKIVYYLSTLLAVLLIAATGFSQSKSSIAVISVNSIKLPYENHQLTDVTRNALEKLDLYYVIDKYDQNEMAEINNIDLKNCSSKNCLTQAGEVLNADNVLTGSIESFGNKIIVKYRVIDVMTKEIERFKIMEFLDLKDQIQSMVDITLKELFSVAYDKNMATKLTQENAFENTINTPEVEKLDLSGPRMGFSVFTGKGAEILQAPENKGGYDGLPFMTQFGYQFEIKYLNEGDFQALFEILPMISGLEQGLFIPSLSFLNGLRSNKTGWEVGFGPQIILSKKASGYYVGDDFILESSGTVPEDVEVIKQTDSRGNITLGTSFIIGVGKTFKSGKLNMPLNIFYKPVKGAHQFGISFGFNTGGLSRR